MVKIVSLSDDAYERLKMIKENRSFSEIIIELTRERKKDNLMRFAGSITKEDGEKIKKELYEDRKRPSRRFN